MSKVILVTDQSPMTFLLTVFSVYTINAPCLDHHVYFFSRLNIKYLFFGAEHEFVVG